MQRTIILRMVLISLCFCIFELSVEAHYWSEKLLLSSSSGISLNSTLRLDITDEIGVCGTYISSAKFAPRSANFMADYFAWSGLAFWGSYSLAKNETAFGLGGGHFHLIKWGDILLGAKADAGYNLTKQMFSASGVSLAQWNGKIGISAKPGSGWDTELSGTLFIYNLKLSKQIMERYGELLKDREVMNLLYSEFLLYNFSATVGYQWDYLGYTGLAVDMAVKWDHDLVISGQLMWEYDIIDELTLNLVAQISSDLDRILNTGLTFNF